MMMEAARLVLYLTTLTGLMVWCVWTIFASVFGPVNFTFIAWIALAYTALCIECWAWVDRNAVSLDD